MMRFVCRDGLWCRNGVREMVLRLESGSDPGLQKVACVFIQEDRHDSFNPHHAC